jgi:hypothetical protein
MGVGDRWKEPWKLQKLVVTLQDCFIEGQMGSESNRRQSEAGKSRSLLTASINSVVLD